MSIFSKSQSTSQMTASEVAAQYGEILTNDTAARIAKQIQSTAAIVMAAREIRQSEETTSYAVSRFSTDFHS